jgi:tetratricopeptide (TPR) repeat protein
LAAAIAGALKTALTPAEKARTALAPTRNLKAWEAYQLGRQRMAGRTFGGLAEAGGFFQQAIDLDPNFALAYAGLADSLALSTNQGAPLIATLQRAQAAAENALKLDPGLSEAWTSAGLIAEIRWQYERAEQMYSRAIELDPNNAMAFKFYGGMLVSTLRIDEGVRSLKRAASLDPLSAIVQINLADALQAQGSFPEAASHYRRAIEIDPAMPAAYATLGICFATAFNRYADAVPLAQKAIDLDPDSTAWPWLLAQFYFQLRDERSWLSTIEQGVRRWPNNGLFLYWSAIRDLLQGDDVGAVRQAERMLALDPRDSAALLILRDANPRNGRYDDVLERYRQAYPELFVPGAPRLDASNYDVAIDLALVLQKRGDAAGAEVLLDAAAQVIGKLPRMGPGGYGFADVEIHALRGDKASALAALRDAEQAGWRIGWRYFQDVDPALDSIRNEPEFKAVFADIERDMARQRARLAARPKDAPLTLQ